MKTIAAGEFKARCLQVMEDVRTKRTTVLITKRGKPLAKLVPPDEQPSDVLGCLAGKVEILGDIVSPITPLEDWDSLK
ncbi:MAG: type II toxin-antitoxin system Phd/YefM family antitoxin [Candidatus Sulfotelmatobacter sp.]